MFTGIVEETGTVKELRREGRAFRLTVAARLVTEGLKTGDSVCTSGVCLTVVDFGRDYFSADVMPETIRRTAFSSLKPGSRVNLERALQLSDRLGGHIVSGHIDGTGKVSSRRDEENAVWFEIATSPEILRYIVEKGSVAVDGISLTVAGTGPKSFSVSIIPHTRSVTTLTDNRPGDTVNIECDILAKYVEKLRFPHHSGGGIDADLLAKNGYL